MKPPISTAPINERSCGCGDAQRRYWSTTKNVTAVAIVADPSPSIHFSTAKAPMIPVTPKIGNDHE